MSNHHHHHHRKHVWWKWLLGIVCVFLLVDGVVLAKFYFSAKDAVDRSFKKVNYKKKRENSVDMSKKQPFSFFWAAIPANTDVHIADEPIPSW